MHEVLVNRLGGLSLPRKSVVRLTDRPDMTLDVYRGRKTTMQFYSLSKQECSTYSYIYLSYDFAVIRWIKSCHQNHMTTRVITLWRVDVMSLTTCQQCVFFLEILPIFEAIKSSFKCSHDTQNLTLVVISNEINETRRRFV